VGLTQLTLFFDQSLHIDLASCQRRLAQLDIGKLPLQVLNQDLRPLTNYRFST
jgi:hypothetical protein